MTNKEGLPKIYIIILNWNGRKDTIECIESAGKLNYPDYEIVVVDNGSTDGSQEFLKERFPGLTIIQTGKNLGFAGGSNEGLRYAMGKGAQYMILLNNDTVVHPDFAMELLNAAKTDERIGITCSKVYFYDRPDSLWYAGYPRRGFSPWRGMLRPRGYGMRDNGMFDTVEETRRPCGTSMMVTRKFCEKVGLFEEEYFCYIEDIEWGIRAEKAGFKVMYVPASKIWHKVSGSSGGAKSLIPLYYVTRNTLRCVAKNFQSTFPVRALRQASILAVFFLSLFTMGLPKIAGIKTIYRGARDCFGGKFGEFKNS